jgi:hypothetical protein
MFGLGRNQFRNRLIVPCNDNGITGLCLGNGGRELRLQVLNRDLIHDLILSYYGLQYGPTVSVFIDASPQHRTITGDEFERLNVYMWVLVVSFSIFFHYESCLSRKQR